MNNKRVMISLLIVLIFNIGLVLNAASPTDYVFHHSFENGWTADVAPGSTSPTVQSGTVAISSQGLSGNAASIGASARLAYSLAGAAPDANGTLNAWIKLNTTPRGMGSIVQGGMRGIFAEQGYDATNGRVRIQMNELVQYSIKGARLPYDYIGYGVLNTVAKDEWHMLTFTWDNTDSRMLMYMDGQMISASAYGSFTSCAKTEIYLGCLGDSSGYPLNGLMDEVKIYDRTLDKSEVLELWLDHQSVNISFLDNAIIKGEENDINFLWRNYSGDPFSNADIDIIITNDSDTEIWRLDNQTVNVAANATLTQRIQHTPSNEGAYNLTVKIDGRTFRTTQLLVLPSNTIHNQMETASGDKTLIEELDLGQYLPADRYIESPGCSIVDSPIGKYRECLSSTCSSGFAVKFRLPDQYDPGQPYILEVDYPDDKTRLFPVVVFQHKDGDSHIRTRSTDTIGIFSGFHNRVSNSIKTKSLIFWPDTRDIVVATYVWNLFSLKGRDPAIAKIRLYAFDGGLPKAAHINCPDSEYGKRSAGVWDEDPTMPGDAWFMNNWLQDVEKLTLENYWKKKWERIIQYLHYTGQNIWNIKAYEYYGDLGGAINSVPQNKGAGRSGYIGGWTTLGAKMLQREGIDFYISLHDKSEGGNNTKGLPGLVTAVGDEYVHYGFAAAAAAGDEAIQRFRNDDTLATVKSTSKVAKLNPLHPIVQAGYLRLIRGYAEQFSHYPNFKGIHFLADLESGLYFHNANEGYSDYNINLFNDDINPSFDIPEFTGGSRFSQRYDWLVANGNLDEWIEWRTGKIHEFHQYIASALTAYRSDLKMMISLPADPDVCRTIYNRYPQPGSGPEYQSLEDYWLDCGIDFSLYDGDANIAVVPAEKPAYNVKYDGNDYYYRTYNHRYYNYDKDFWEITANSSTRSAFISMHGCIEMLPVSGAESQIPTPYWGWTIGAFGAYNDGTLHAFALPHPSNESAFLSTYIHAIAENDALSITHGWWVIPDAGDHERFIQFIRGYLSIPAEDFADVPGMDDPVKMRVFNGSGHGFIYMVNREAYPATVTVSLSGVEGISLTNRGTGGKIGLEPDGDSRILEITLKPYELLSIEGPPTMVVNNAAATIAQAEIDAVEDLLAQYALAVGTGDAVYQMGLEMFDNAQYSTLHYLSDSQPVRSQRRYNVSGTVSGAATTVELFIEGLDDRKLISDSSGAYAFERIGRGEYTITPRREGYTFAPAQRTFTVTTANITGLDFTATSVPFIAIADDGEIAEGSEDGETIAVTLSGASFTDPLTPANWTVSNLPAGVSWSITRGDATHATITLAGDRTADYDSDITDVTVSCSATEQDSGGALSDDLGATFSADDDTEAISIADDGDITEGAEDGELITVTLSGGTFADPLDPAGWFIAGQPTGVSIGGVSRIDAAHAAITLSGNATEDYDSDILDFTVVCAVDQFSDGIHALAADSGVTFTAIVEGGGGPALSYSSSLFNEAVANDGSIDNTTPVAITLTDDSFTAAAVSGGHVNASNVPAGLSADFTRVSDTQITMSLTGNAASHAAADSVSDLTVSFDDGAFASGDASAVANAVKSDLAVNFDDPLSADYTVGASGADYTTIAAAIAACSGGEVIEVIDAIHTEDAITIDKDNLTIQGQGMDSTIVQAGTSLAVADDRVFLVSSTISGATIKDMTLRYGDRSSNGGAIYSSTDLTLEACRITDCRASAAGGAISMGYKDDLLIGKSLTITNSVIENCESTSTDSAEGGGALFANTTGAVIIVDSTLADNTAASRGGAVRGNCDMTITGCALTGNTAGYYGGGFYLNDATHKVIENCTVSGNAANDATYGGGGFYITGTSATIEIYNSTVADNSAAGYGGGMFISTYPSWVKLYNSIVADNSATVSAADIRDGADAGSRRISVAEYNLVESGTGNSITNGIDGNIVGSAPVLGALQNNGGPTDTIMPDGASPALQAIPRGSDPYYNDSPAEDQRGYWIDRPTDNPDYLNRTIGACWDGASPTPARGFRGRMD